jgi:ribosomal protein L7/L12
MHNLFETDIKTLSDDELNALSLIVYEEQNKRMQTREYPALTPVEEGIAFVSRIAAIKAYRTSTGLTFRESKFVIDRYLYPNSRY